MTAGTADPGNTAWVLASSALVLLMTFGAAFFYGGMVRSKSVLNTLMMNVVCVVVVGVTWVLCGFSLTFGNDTYRGFLGSFGTAAAYWSPDALVGFASTDPAVAWPGPEPLPLLAFAMFQLMFAIITPALVSGALVERTRFWAWTVFVAVWSIVVYAPVAHWVFAFDGFLGPESTGGWIANQLKAVDFAGGTVVHMNAGATALALAIVLGRRSGWPARVARPHNLPFTLLGAALLWFGWYGFNAGSALAANGLAALAFANTTIATCVAVLAWLLVEQIRTGRPTTLGAASGAIAGLVAITPACGFVDMWGAVAVGLAAGVVCPIACAWKFWLRLDDSLDVVAIHLVGGLVGTLLVGVFANRAVNPAALNDNGLLYGGGLVQLQRQAIAAGVVGGYAFLATLVIGYLIRLTIGFRVRPHKEADGLDISEHAEAGYDFDEPAPAGGDPRALGPEQIRAIERQVEHTLVRHRAESTPPPGYGTAAPGAQGGGGYRQLPGHQTGTFQQVPPHQTGTFRAVPHAGTLGQPPPRQEH